MCNMNTKHHLNILMDKLHLVSWQQLEFHTISNKLLQGLAQRTSLFALSTQIQFKFNSNLKA